MPATAAAPPAWPGRGAARAGRWLALAALVLWGHALLIQALAPPASRLGGRPHAAPIELRRLTLTVPPPARRLPDQPDQSDQPDPPALPSAAEPPAEPRRDARADDRSPAPASPASPAAGAVADESAAAADADAAAGHDAAATPRDPSATEPGAQAPPPLYATRLPDPVQLRYALRYNGHASEALLNWRHDGQRYSLALDGQDLPGSGGRIGRRGPPLAQSSQGTLDANGLAPERFVDRRPRGRQQAANFRRDTGRIGFSGPAVELPAWPGAQDRLSWLAQLAAVLAAGHAGDEVQLFVVDARGAGGLWQLRRQPDEALQTPWGEALLQLWQREPPRPEGLRVQAWLDATRGHWPVLLRFTALRSGDVFELRLQAEPAVPDRPTPP